MEALHLVLLQLQAGLDVLIIVALQEERRIPIAVVVGFTGDPATTCPLGDPCHLPVFLPTRAAQGEPLSAHRIILELPVVHMDDVGADSVQEVLGVRDQDKDALEPAKEKAAPGWKRP